jgi:hypothetical protein
LNGAQVFAERGGELGGRRGGADRCQDPPTLATHLSPLHTLPQRARRKAPGWNYNFSELRPGFGKLQRVPARLVRRVARRPGGRRVSDGRLQFLLRIRQRPPPLRPPAPRSSRPSATLSLLVLSRLAAALPRHALLCWPAEGEFESCGFSRRRRRRSGVALAPGGGGQGALPRLSVTAWVLRGVAEILNSRWTHTRLWAPRAAK